MHRTALIPAALAALPPQSYDQLQPDLQALRTTAPSTANGAFQGNAQSGAGQVCTASINAHMVVQPTSFQGSASPERSGLSSASPKAKLSGGVQLCLRRVMVPVLRGRP